MTRNEIIREIEGLYPADAENAIVADKGERLLTAAVESFHTWRHESYQVLWQYLKLCRKARSEELE